jgi:hypothetical protein
MRVEPTAARHLGEQRRYFPDWTDLSLENCPELEADRNSYLAGGYAEEFGYRATLSSSRGVPLLDDEPPELSIEWHSQARAMHPGYPLRAHPIADDFDSLVATQDANAVLREAREAGDADRHGRFVAVFPPRFERERHDAARRAAIVSTRLSAALFSLQWRLRHR